MDHFANNVFQKNNGTHSAQKQLALIVSKFPCVDETFILREMQALAEAGFAFDIYSIKKSADTVVQPQTVRLQAFLINENFFFSSRLWRAHFYYLWKKPLGYCAALLSFFRHMWQAPMSLLKTLLLFPQAVGFCRTMQENRIAHVHAFWATYPCAVAWVARYLLDVPYSFSAHAHDIYQDSAMLRAKLRHAEFVMTCTEKNRAYLSGLVPAQAGKIKRIYHGLNLQKFREDAEFHKAEDGVLRILSIGTLYKTKGFDVLIEACALLKQSGEPFHCKIAGDGPERKRLHKLIAVHALQNEVTMTGYLDQESLRPLRHWATVFVLLPRPYLHWGLPNVYIEALASKLAVVATPLNAIEELVRHRETGLIVESDDPQAAAEALVQMRQFPADRQRMAEAGQKRAYEMFDQRRTSAQVIELFRQTIGTAAEEQSTCPTA